MKFLLDQNLSPRLVKKLKGEIDPVIHVDWLEMATAGDLVIWNYARDGDYTIITKDKDFLERSALMGHPPKVIHLRLGNCTVQQIVELLISQSGQIRAFVRQRARSYLLLP